MIIVQATDGLGNQLFQYAIGRKLSLLYKTDLFIDTTHFINNKHRQFLLNFLYTKFSEINNYKRFALKHPLSFLKLRSGVLTIFQEDHRLSGNSLQFTKNSFLKGYWGEEDYFKDIRNILLEDLKLKKEYQTNLFQLIQREVSQVNSVSIHVRRGDYLEDKNKFLFENLNISYYNNAIELITSKVPNAKFYIFSDDINWTKRNLPIKSDHVYVNESNSLKDFEELILMSSCTHNIIANSTFSWWGGWLNKNVNKLVIQPKNWYKDKDLQHSFELNQTMFSEKFIRI